MDIGKLKDELVVDEGLRLAPYRDTVGKLTIGVGRNLEDRGITEDEAMFILGTDLRMVCADLDREAPWWRGMTDARKRALANMCFNLGWPRLSGFRRMLDALKSEDYERAAAEALDSRWALQVGARAQRIATMLREG